MKCVLVYKGTPRSPALTRGAKQHPKIRRQLSQYRLHCSCEIQPGGFNGVLELWEYLRCATAPRRRRRRSRERRHTELDALIFTSAMAKGNNNVVMEKYEVGRLLGQGAFAKVHVGRRLSSGESVAIKIIEKERVTKAGHAEQIKREIAVMRLADHPHIVRLAEVMASRHKIYFVMELCRGGDLLARVPAGAGLAEEDARRYFRQLISAVDYCHGHGIFHRDLKPENLLLDDAGELKVADFGLSALTAARRDQGSLLRTACGTPAYVAPEVIGKAGYEGAKADIWSCGVILFVLVAGYLPFAGANVVEMYKKIGRGEFHCPPRFSPRLQRLLRRILNPDPAARATVEQIRSSSWFRKGTVEQIRSSPARRGAAKVPADVEKAFAGVARMNAFEIIGMSTGFDLSGLFVERERMNEARFTSAHPAPAIMAKLEDVARELKMSVRQSQGSGAMMMTSGSLVVDVEIFEIAPSHHLVEMKKLSGDSLEYKKALDESIRPALKDIVWAWHGDAATAARVECN